MISATQPSAAERAASLKRLTESKMELPSLPTIVQKMMSALDDDRTSTRQLAAIVETDLAISVRVLRLCNSSVYGLSRKIGNVAESVSVIGVSELRNLVVSASTKALYKKFGPIEKALWEHSIGCAVATRMVAQHYAPAVKESAFLAGQLHDIGKVITATHLPQKYAALEAAAADRPYLQAELEILGFTHPDVGKLMLKSWKMPADVEAAVFHHHSLGLCQSVEPAQARLTACVVLGDVLCLEHGIGGPAERDVDPDDTQDALELLGKTEDDLAELSKSFIETFQAERANLV